METSSDVHEAEAYIPRDPGPDVERYWLPSTHAFAIESARQARIVGNSGLAVDDATLERVADAIMDAASPPPWQFLTASERQNGLPRGLWEAVQGYLADRPEIDADVDIRWRDGRRTLIVRIVGDPEPHRAPLARIAGNRVIVERRPVRPPHTVAELVAIAERVCADEPELATLGLYVAWVEGPPGGDMVEDWPPGVVEVHVAGGRDEGAAAAVFAARYGDAVSVVWLGPRRVREVLRPFGSWTSGGRWLRVFFALDPNGEEPGSARVAEESDQRIVIALSGFEPARIIRTRIGGFDPRHADVELREPVGARAVIDASAGVVRPSLAELGLPAERPPLLRVVRLDAPGPIRRRRAQVWFSATDNDAVYEAMVAAGDPPLDDHGDPVMMPAVRRDVLDAIRRDIADSRLAWRERLRLSWVRDALVVERDNDGVQAFMPGPDSLYEVGPLGFPRGPSQWREVDPPLPDGPIDADTAVDLLSRVRNRHPVLNLIFGRVNIDVLRAAHARVTDEAIRDAVDDEIAERTHGLPPMLFRNHLRRLERNTSEYRDHDAGYLADFVALVGRERILALVPDAGERVLALAGAERDPNARRSLASALGELGHGPGIP